jgi:hypothetical protein
MELAKSGQKSEKVTAPTIVEFCTRGLSCERLGCGMARNL